MAVTGRPPKAPGERVNRHPLQHDWTDVEEEDVNDEETIDELPDCGGLIPENGDGTCILCGRRSEEHDDG